jgi:hypothetical protein
VNTPPLNALRAILYGTLTVGVLDGSYAAIMSTVRGSNPVRMFQSVASGLLGRTSYQGGIATAMLGALIHFFIAGCVVTTYYVASRRIRLLVERPFLCGAIYGILVYAFMNYVVIPLSAIGPLPFRLSGFIGGILIHIAGVGIPSALFAARVR